MCCRYYADLSGDLEEFGEALNRAPLTEKMTAHFGRPVKTWGEIRPADLAPVFATTRSGGGTVFPMFWGFTGRSALLINARSETAGTRPAFAEAWAAHRCAVPAACYFEWIHLTGPDGRKKTGDKYRIRPVGTETAWLAGLYRMEEGFPHFTVLTREPAESIRFIHDRMPVILDREHAEAWIRPDNDPARIVKTALNDMIYEKSL